VTPAGDVAGEQQLVAGRERSNDESVEVETLTEHPHEVT